MSRTPLILLFTFMVTIWSLSFVVIKHAALEIPPVILALLRAVGSALVMIPIAWWDSRQHPHSRWNWADAPKLLAAATCGITINQVLYVVGVSRTSVAHASIVMALNPATVYMLALLMGLEQPAVRRFVGMGAALVGVGLLQWSRDSGNATTFGDLLVFIGSSGFAMGRSGLNGFGGDGFPAQRHVKVDFILGRGPGQAVGPDFVELVAGRAQRHHRGDDLNVAAAAVVAARGLSDRPGLVSAFQSPTPTADWTLRLGQGLRRVLCLRLGPRR